MTHEGRAPSEAQDEMEEAVVETIILHRYNAEEVGDLLTQDRFEYLIKWKDNESLFSWEPEVRCMLTQECAVDAEDMVYKYWTERQAMPANEALQRVRQMQAKIARQAAAQSAVQRAGSASIPYAAADASHAAPSRLSGTENRAVHAPTAVSSGASAPASAPAPTPVLAAPVPASAAAQQPVRRGRGRPRKSERPPTAAAPSAKSPAEADWDAHVAHVARIARDPSNELHASLVFRDGTQGTFPTSLANVRCPQALLAFYEHHVVYPLP